MVLDKLGASLKGTLNKIAKAVFVDEKLINELVKDIQRALLQADVNVKLVFSLSNKIKERITKEDTPAGLTKKEYLINIVYEELAEFLGGEGSKITIEKKPFKIMMVGLFGAGKTTTCGKLSKFFSKRGHKVCMIGLDIHRPAAITQLEQIGSQINIPVFVDKDLKDVNAIYEKYEAQLNEFDVVILDTAGRDALSEDLIEEIESLNKRAEPQERLLVLSADIGQAAQRQAEQFHESVHVTGVVATKMDGTAKAGGALSACAVTQAPIKFIGVGEKVDDLEEFKPKNFVGRLLGMGDLEALLEKAKEAITEEDAEELGKRMLKGDFNLVDLYDQMQAMKKMGPLTKVMDMIPGMGGVKIPKDMLQQQEGKLDSWKVLMQSMTQEELEDPDLIDSQRIDRVCRGSGKSATEVRELLKQYRQGKKMMKMMKGSGDVNKMMKKMKGKIPGM